MKNYIFISILGVLVLSCSDNPQPQPQMSMAEVQEKLLEANVRAAKLESEQIDEYVKENKLEVVKTGTGLRYMIYQKGDGDVFPQENTEVAINYSITLLDGTSCYSTEGKSEVLVIGKSYAESGLQEALTYLKEGDKAVVIIPSHLAHGLAGDLNKIPIRATIVYDLKLVKVN